MADITEQYIASHYHSSGKQIPFNVINAMSKDGPFEFENKPGDVVARPIREELRLYPKGRDSIPFIAFSEIEEKVFLGRAVDRCRWRDRDCAFKRIEFDCDVKAIDREIKSREVFLEALEHSQAQTIERRNELMERRFNVVPIIAVVIVTENMDVDDAAQQSPKAMGILMPYGGRSLESLVESPESNGAIAPASPASRDLEVSIRQLRDLTRGVEELARAGVVHGDINDRNTLLKPFEESDGEARHEQSRLVLVDLGDTAPEYKSDAYALGDLLIWCMDKCSLWSDADRKMVQNAAMVLKDTGDFQMAMGILEGGNKLR